MTVELLFIKYLLIPIVVAAAMVGFTIYAKANELLRPGRLMLYVLLQALCIVLPAAFGFFAYQFVPNGLILLQVTFLLLGIAGTAFLQTGVFQGIGFDEKPLPIFLAVLTSLLLGTWGFFLLFETFSTLGYSHWVAFTSVWFLFPFLFHWGRREYLNVPPAYYHILDPLEYRPPGEEIWEEVDYLRMANISLRIRHAPQDQQFSSYPVKAPGEVPIAAWFTRYLQDQRLKFPNSPIETEERGEPYCWIFYTTRLFIFNRPIDPEKTFKSYRIRRKSVVYVRRVQKETSVQ